MRGLVGKFLTGAAQVAVPAAQNIVQQRFQEQRDAALQKYRMEENKANQDFTRAENDKTRAQGERQNAQQVALEAGRLGVQQEQLRQQGERNEADMKNDNLRTDAVVRQAEAAIESGNLDAEQKRILVDLQKTAMNRNLPLEERRAALEDLAMLTDKGVDNYQATTLYSDEEDGLGQQRRATGILNRRTGEIVPAAAPAKSGVAQPQSQEEYDALPSGALFVDPDDGQTYRKP